MESNEKRLTGEVSSRTIESAIKGAILHYYQAIRIERVCSVEDAKEYTLETIHHIIDDLGLQTGANDLELQDQVADLLAKIWRGEHINKEEVAPIYKRYLMEISGNTKDGEHS